MFPPLTSSKKVFIINFTRWFHIAFQKKKQWNDKWQTWGILRELLTKRETKKKGYVLPLRTQSSSFWLPLPANGEVMLKTIYLLYSWPKTKLASITEHSIKKAQESQNCTILTEQTWWIKHSYIYQTVKEQQASNVNILITFWNYSLYIYKFVKNLNLLRVCFNHDVMYLWHQEFKVMKATKQNHDLFFLTLLLLH